MIRQIIREVLRNEEVDDIVTLIWNLRDRFEEQGNDFRNVEVDEEFQLSVKMLSSLIRNNKEKLLNAWRTIDDINLDAFSNEDNAFIDFLFWQNYKILNKIDLSNENFMKLISQIELLSKYIDGQGPKHNKIMYMNMIAENALKMFENCEFDYTHEDTFGRYEHDGFIISIFNGKSSQAEDVIDVLDREYTHLLRARGEKDYS